MPTVQHSTSHSTWCSHPAIIIIYITLAKNTWLLFSQSAAIFSNSDIIKLTTTNTIFSFPPLFIKILESQLGEKPLVLASPVSLLKCLFDLLLGFFSLRGLLEGFSGNNGLERLQLQRVSGGH